MKKALIVIDVQKDFVDGVLGSEAAQKIVPNVVDVIKSGDWDDILVTYDTHDEDYLNTLEGRKLPVVHCIENTDGWHLDKNVEEAIKDICFKKYNIPFVFKKFYKHTFGSIELAEYVKEKGYDVVEILGLDSDICVVSNALLIRAFNPNIEIKVKANACAGVTKESHDAALLTMKMCQIDVDEGQFQLAAPEAV